MLFETSDYSVLGADDENESICSISDIQRNLIHEFKGQKDYLEVFLRIKPVTKYNTEQDNDQKYLDVESDEAVLVHPLREAAVPPPTFVGAGMGGAGARSRQPGVGGGPRLQNIGSFMNNNQQQSLKFTFSRVFDETTSQKLFFDEAVQSTVREFVDGQNCLLFAYGVTNSGKTYTMQGTPSDAGVVPRTFDVIFNSLGNRLYGKSDLKPSRFCDVELLDEEAESREISLKESILRQIYAQPKKFSINFSANSSSSDVSKSQLSCLTTDESNASKIGRENLIDEEISTIVANRRREQASVAVTVANRVRFSIWASFAEVYNEQVYDLLVPPPEEVKLRRLRATNGTAAGTYRPSQGRNAPGQQRSTRAKCMSPTFNGRKERALLHVKEDVQGRPYINGLREVNITSADEAFKLLTLGRRNLQMAYTKLNESSSRSHCIFTLKLMRVLESRNGSDIKHTKFNILSLCDLAGIERSCKTQNVGDRVKEAGNINNSLFTLGRCIQAIRHNQVSQASDRHLLPPFRDSKLTRLFQPFLIGKGRAKMVVTVNQCRSMYPENLNAIKFSAIAKQVTMAPAPVVLINISQPIVEQKRKSNPRQTIEWASASEVRKHKALPFFGNIHVKENDDDDDNEEEEVTIDGDDNSSDDEDDEDSVVSTDKLKRLEEENEQLKKDNMCLKGRIEKMTKETEIVVDNLHKKYEELLERAELRHEDAMDKRRDLLTTAYEKALKRRRCDDVDDDHQTVKKENMSARIKDLEEELHTCNQQLTNWKQNYDVSVREVRSLTQEMTEVKFQAAAERMQVAERSSQIEMESLEMKAELERQRELHASTETRHNYEVDVLNNQISDMEEINKSLKSELNILSILASSNKDELHKIRSQNFELLVRIRQLELDSVETSNNSKPVLCDKTLGLNDPDITTKLDLSNFLDNISFAEKVLRAKNEDVISCEINRDGVSSSDDDDNTKGSEAVSYPRDNDKDLFSDSLNMVFEKAKENIASDVSYENNSLLKSMNGDAKAVDAVSCDVDATVDYCKGDDDTEQDDKDAIDNNDMVERDSLEARPELQGSVATSDSLEDVVDSPTNDIGSTAWDLSHVHGFVPYIDESYTEMSEAEKNHQEESSAPQTTSPEVHGCQKSSPKFSIPTSSYHTLIISSPPRSFDLQQHSKEEVPDASSVGSDSTTLESNTPKFVAPDETVTASLFRSTRKTRNTDSTVGASSQEEEEDMHFKTPHPPYKTRPVILSSDECDANYEPACSVIKQTSTARKTKTSTRTKVKMEKEVDNDDFVTTDMKENSSTRKSTRKTQQPSGPATTGRRRKNLLKSDDAQLLDLPCEESLREDEPSPLSTLKRQLRSRRV